MLSYISVTCTRLSLQFSVAGSKVIRNNCVRRRENMGTRLCNYRDFASMLVHLGVVDTYFVCKCESGIHFTFMQSSA